VKDVYDRVWRLFLPFSRPTRGIFPLGRQSSFRGTFANNTRIELSFPDMLNDNPDSQSWVEPAGLSNASFPLMHIRDVPSLFSTPKNAWRLLAHETGHAMHFSSLPRAKRIDIEVDYAAYIATHIGHSGHRIDVASSPFVALIEAIGVFSERFFFFSKFIRPDLIGASLMIAFIADELNDHSLASEMPPNRYTAIGTISNNIITPTLLGNDVEGAVYGAIFLDFANRIGLRNVLSYLVRSTATTFKELRTFVRRRALNTDDIVHINAVRTTWGM
jgi:hypothetical protein